MYIKTDEEGNVTHVSDVEEYGYQYFDYPLTRVSMNTLLYKTLYVQDGLLRERPPVIPYYSERASEYPPIGDQLDALWKLIQANSDKIDLGEAASLLKAVQDVKDKYPKAP